MDLQTLKDTYAQEQGYEDWKELREELYGNVPELRIEEYMNEICIRAQKAALEKAAEYFDMYWNKSAITNPDNLIR